MSQINTPNVSRETTHEGAPAARLNNVQQLRRSVCASLLWEDQFYESGVKIAERVKDLVQKCGPRDVAELAIQAREDFKLRHMPLLLTRELARHPLRPARMVADTLARVIQRADELSEFVAIYQLDGKDQPLSKQVKRGLALALRKFDEYQLAKYDRANAVRLRDVMFLVHPKPKDEAQAALFKRLAENQLATPDTWEVALSGGADKKETFERLIRENNLGYLALLRNLRNMQQAGVDQALVESAIRARRGAERVLPFRFLTAATHAPMYADALNEAMLAAAPTEKLAGKTIVLVDISGSMNSPVSHRSELQRFDAAAGVAVIAREICESVRVMAFSDKLKEVKNVRGLALRDGIVNAMPHGGTELGNAVKYANDQGYDRLIVITDEQSCSPVPAPLKGKRGYMVNVASYQNGVGYGPWVRIDGWSEAVVRFICEYEKQEAADA